MDPDCLETEFLDVVTSIIGGLRACSISEDRAESAILIMYVIRQKKGSAISQGPTDETLHPCSLLKACSEGNLLIHLSAAIKPVFEG